LQYIAHPPWQSNLGFSQPVEKCFPPFAFGPRLVLGARSTVLGFRAREGGIERPAHVMLSLRTWWLIKGRPRHSFLFSILCYFASHKNNPQPLFIARHLFNPGRDCYAIAKRTMITPFSTYNDGGSPNAKPLHNFRQSSEDEQ
jgi:hypothetical protein